MDIKGACIFLFMIQEKSFIRDQIAPDQKWPIHIIPKLLK